MTAAASPHLAGIATRTTPSTLTVLRVELRKLAAQARVRVSIVGAALVPLVVVLILKAQPGVPKDTLYGRHIKESGFALPLLLLGFAGQWLFPVLTAVVAGDIFASEDHHGTWKTLLTRSVSRTQVFAAKTLAAGAFALTVLATLAASTIAASVLLVGRQSLVGLTGQVIPPTTAAWLVVVSWATSAPPLLAFTAVAILISVATRSPAAGIVGPLVIGLVLQLASVVGGIDPIRRVLPTTPFDAWHGLLAQHRYFGLIGQGAVVSAGWTVACLAAAYVVLRRRDISGG